MFRWMLVVFVVSVAVWCVADDAGKRVYSESFKKGATRVTEQTLDVTLTPDHARQDFRVLDSLGKPRYTLHFVPDIQAGDTKILGWFVSWRMRVIRSTTVCFQRLRTWPEIPSSSGGSMPGNIPRPCCRRSVCSKWNSSIA